MKKEVLLLQLNGKKKNYNKKWYQGETAITAIGQGYTQTTPIQLALATAKLINPNKNSTSSSLIKDNYYSGALSNLSHAT